MLPTLLGDFKEQYDSVAIHLKVANNEGVVSMVEQNTIDLGVVESPVTNKNLVMEVCKRDSLVAIVPPGHPFVGRARVTFPEVLDYPFICREEGSGTCEVIGAQLNQLDNGEASLKIAMELGSPEAVKGAVEAGMGVSVVSRTTIQKELRLGTLIAIELDPPLDRLSIRSRSVGQE